MNRQDARNAALIALMALSTALGQAATDQSGLMAWQVDSMQKIFKDVVPPTEATNQPVIDAARNEVISAQVVAWCAEPMTGLTCRASPLKLGAGQPIPAPRVRWVSYVPVRVGKWMGGPLRPRPCDYPDPLLENAPATNGPGTPQPIWLTYKIPADTSPGLYQGEVVVEATIQGKVQAMNVPLGIQVYAAKLPDTRTLKVSNWAWFDNPSSARLCGVEELYSEPFWKLMEAVAQNMAAHRQNVILTPTTCVEWEKGARDLITAKLNPQGKLEIDFSLFDRWVTLFRAAGVDGLIEGAHLAGRGKGKSGFQSVAWKAEGGEAVRVKVDSLSEEYDQYLAFYLPALQKHLEEKGWLKSYVQHLFDEAADSHAETYNLLAKRVKTYAPWMRIIDAVSTAKVLESVDIMVPLYGSGFTRQAAAERERVKEKELWFYTCIAPSPLNRFIEEALTHPRLLHWANFANKTTGYLHWGYNWWIGRKNPIEGQFHSKLLAGDDWIVYPKPGGVLDSIRFEAMIEGLQDHELLVTLAARDAKAAGRICKSLMASKKNPKVYNQLTYDDSVEALRAARRELLKALSE